MDTWLIEYKTTQWKKRYWKEIDWKQYLVCTKCGQLKELSTDNYYKHKDWFMWYCSYCKECRKNVYEFDKDLIRTRKHNCYIKNRDKRLLYYREYNKRDYVKENHYNNTDMHKHSIRIKTQKYIKSLWLRPSKCPICWYEWPIQAHHLNYNKWNEVVFCCQTCHSQIHHWIINCPQPIDLLLINIEWQLV